MSLWKIAWRSMQQRSFSSLLTGLSMALGVALVVAVLVIYGVTRTHFMQSAQGYHLIVGAKGGKLQLVLNTVYHLSQPIENIPYSFYKEFTEGRFASITRTAIPYCLGDSYLVDDQTFRVVGTTPGMFEEIQYGVNRDGSPQKYAFAAGRNFKPQAFFEAVIGSIVAARAGLGVGDSFEPSHGIVEEGDELHKHDAFRIVGVLEPTGTPNDRALFVNIEGFYLLDGHSKEGADDGHEKGEGQDEGTADEKGEGPDDHKHDAHDHDDHGHDHGSHGHAHHHEPLPESQREVTAVLVLLESDLVSQGVYTQVNEGQVAQAVYPAREVIQLFQRIVGPLQTLLLLLTVMIVIVAGIGILVSIYNSMNDRQHEIAVMRALGAGRTTVMAVVLLESILLAVAGGVAGLLLGHGLLALASPYLVEQTGVAIHFLQFSSKEFILIPALVGLAAVVGFLPALTAYRTDVAKALTANP